MLLASALAAVMSTGHGGAEVLRGMFTPKLLTDPPQQGKHGRKHRSSGSGSRTYRGGNMTAHCGHKQAAKYAKQISANAFNVHFDARMRWLERNAHVIAKRNADQERAAGPDGGRNAIRRGRK